MMRYSAGGAPPVAHMEPRRRSVARSILAHTGCATFSHMASPNAVTHKLFSQMAALDNISDLQLGNIKHIFYWPCCYGDLFSTLREAACHPVFHPALFH